MLEIKGKYTSAKIFAETYEEEAINVVYDMCNSPAFEGIQVRLEPDFHKGTGCAVGTTYPLGDYLNPSHIGVDIGCTISAHKLSKIINPSDYPNIEHKIKEAIPFGFEINERVVFDEKRFYKFLNSEYNKVTLVRYPNSIKLGVIKLIQYSVRMDSKVGIASESLSRHSVSYSQPTSDAVGGYPASYMSFLKPYMKARF